MDKTIFDYSDDVERLLVEACRMLSFKFSPLIEKLCTSQTSEDFDMNVEALTKIIEVYKTEKKEKEKIDNLLFYSLEENKSLVNSLKDARDKIEELEDVQQAIIKERNTLEQEKSDLESEIRELK